MISNPNVLIRNFSDKEGLVFSGELGQTQTFDYNSDKQYAIVQVQVNKATSGGTYIDTTAIGGSFADRFNAPILRSLDVTTIIGRFLFNTVGTFCFYMDLSSHSQFRLHLVANSSEPANVDVRVGFVNDIKLLHNEIRVANTTKKEGLVHSGVLSALKVFRYQKIQYNYLRLSVKVKIAGGSTSYINTSIPFGVTADKTNAPVIFSKEGWEGAIYFDRIGSFEYYADISTIDQFDLRLNGSAIDSPDVDIRVSFTNVKDIPIHFRPEKSKYEGRRLRIKDSEVVLNELTSPQLKLERGRYMVFHLESSGVSSSRPYTYFRVKNIDGTTVYPKSYNSYFEEIALPDEGFPRIDLRKVYLGYVFVDLDSVDAVEWVSVNTSIGASADLNLNLSFVEQTNIVDDYVQNRIVEYPKLQIGNNKFEFRFIDTMKDACGNYYINYDGSGSSVTIYNGTKKITVTSSVIGQGNFSKAMLVPFDIERVNTQDNMGIIVNTVGGWMYCDITNVDNALVPEKWKQVKFWEKIGTKRKIPTKNLESVDAFHRYDTTLSSDRYLHDETITVDSNTLIAYQGTTELPVLGLPARTKKLVLWGDYVVDKSRPNVWATTDGGANIVSVYDFVGNYLPESGSINTSLFQNYNEGLILNKVNRNIPSSATKEPVSKYTIETVSFNSITKGVTTVVNAPGHGLLDLDIVAFTGSSTSEWNQLRTSELTIDSMGDNVYFVKVLNADSFEIVEYVGSYDTQISCRHIHSVNETKTGVLIATGEEYPNSWIMYFEQRYKDISQRVDVMKTIHKVYRLNSSETGLQRACGMLMDDLSSDPTILFNSDTSHVVIDNMNIEGRSISDCPLFVSQGTWRGKLSQIDDWSAWECVIPAPEPGIWMFKYNNIILVYYMLGGMAISLDCGNTFEYFPEGGSSQINGVYKGQIVIGGGYALKRL